MNPVRQRILLAGAPRSGTTWVANVLAAAPAATVAVEPDNEKTSLLALVLKNGLPRFPVLDPGAADPGYARLWRYAFDGRFGPFLSRSWLTRASVPRGRWAESRIAARPVAVPGAAHAAATAVPRPPANGAARIVKTVHAVLSLDWVCEVARPHRVVVVGRHPCAVIDSWRRLDMPDAARLWTAGRDWLVARDALPTGLDTDAPLVQMALQAGLIYRCIDDFCDRHDDVVRVSHEALCRDPAGGYGRLFERLGLTWTDEAERALAASNREGRGYRPVRVAAREVGKWRGRFDAGELARIEAVLAAFGVSVPPAD